MDSTSLVTLKVARNRRNFRYARSQVAILLASSIYIHKSRRRQTKRTSLTSMLGSSVVKAFFIPKRGTEIDEDLYVSICRNAMSKNQSNVRILTSTVTYAIIIIQCGDCTTIGTYMYQQIACV